MEVIRTLHRHLRPTSHAGRICEPGHPTPCPKFGVAHCVWGPGEQPAAVPAEGQPSSHVVSFPTGPAPTSGSAHFNKFYLAAKLTQDEFCTRSRNRWIQAHLRPRMRRGGDLSPPSDACSWPSGGESPSRLQLTVGMTRASLHFAERVQRTGVANELRCVYTPELRPVQERSQHPRDNIPRGAS